MNIDISYSGNTVDVTINGNIDAAGTTQLNDKFSEITKKSEIKNANLNLKAVNAINSAGIGKFLKFYKHFDSIGGEFKIVSISDKLYELFTDINLHKIITIKK